ncbi:unnamed protein product [Effrenium voratum]|uniref:MYND-type domain-containing protein n=1 Tax=Effrenium voratum TaxID=2562239 RepID=A0AA36I4P8_9DINO|nr:unnamed protein product [Effrenium voratum]
MAMCFRCGLAGSVFVCSRCHQVYFCSPQCQKGGWRQHRPDCLQARKPHPRVRVYANLGALHGEVDVEVPSSSSLRDIRQKLATVFGSGSCRLFACGEEVLSLEHFWEVRQRDIIVSAGVPLRGPSSPERMDHPSTRYPASLVGSTVARIAADDPEVEHLLRAPVPIVVTGSKLADKAVGRWSFDYLERTLADVDNFFVLCAPEESQGRFAYYDFSDGKNPCAYNVVPGNRRVEMRFSEFRQKEWTERMSKSCTAGLARPFGVATCRRRRPSLNAGVLQAGQQTELLAQRPRLFARAACNLEVQLLGLDDIALFTQECPSLREKFLEGALLGVYPPEFIAGFVDTIFTQLMEKCRALGRQASESRSTVTRFMAALGRAVQNLEATGAERGAA